MFSNGRRRWRPIVATALAAVVLGGVVAQRSLSGPGGTEAKAIAAREEDMVVTDGITVQRVSFPSQGDTIAGRLYPAANRQGPAPVVAILGPMTFVKEQAPTLYAERLSRLGYTTLVNGG